MFSIQQYIQHCPVMADREAKNTKAGAISRAALLFPLGVRTPGSHNLGLKAAGMIGVQVSLGSTQFTRIPRGSKFLDKDRVKETIAPLEVS